MSAELVIVGDEAYLPEEYERLERRRASDRERLRKKRMDPEYRERIRLYHRGWCERNREHVNAYQREWIRAKRARS